MAKCDAEEATAWWRCDLKAVSLYIQLNARCSLKMLKMLEFLSLSELQKSSSGGSGCIPLLCPGGGYRLE